MRNVCVLGIGQSVFGKFPERSVASLGCEAAIAALRDAGIEPRQLQVAYASRLYSEMITAQTILKDIGIVGIEMANVENACAGGATGVRQLWKDIAAGIADVGLALGVESMTTSPVAGKLIPPSEDDLEGQLGMAMPSVFALSARRLMETHGATIEDFALVSVKAHDSGLLNPNAQYRKKFTVEQVVNSRMISDPITLLQCCPNTDGAAAIILCSEEFARHYTARPVRITASVVLSGDYFYKKDDLTSFTFGHRAARRAYEMAGVDPLDLDLVEIHDAFASEEIIHYEDLELCPRGEGIALLRSGATSLGGRIPVNPSGGLLSLGHPLSASGVRNICEITLHLRGQAGERQTPNAKVGLAQMLGGSAAGLESGAAAVHILTT
ncbi:benzoylsuccinyl-CoA thiolase BbsB subunit [Bradyrhizobium diazoefficiens]